MSAFRQTKSFTVEVVKGGWIFEWDDPSRAKSFEESQMGTWPRPRAPETSGREIITTEKKLLERIKAFI